VSLVSRLRGGRKPPGAPESLHQSLVRCPRQKGKQLGFTLSEIHDILACRKENSGKTELEDFLGGSPLKVFVKLLFISLVVSALLMWLDLRPIEILHGVQNLINRIYALGFDAVLIVVEYVATGVVIVVPIWILLRLMKKGSKR
jgi:hypothetical protein